MIRVEIDTINQIQYLIHQTNWEKPQVFTVLMVSDGAPNIWPQNQPWNDSWRYFKIVGELISDVDFETLAPCFVGSDIRYGSNIGYQKTWPEPLINPTLTRCFCGFPTVLVCLCEVKVTVCTMGYGHPRIIWLVVYLPLWKIYKNMKVSWGY